MSAVDNDQVGEPGSQAVAALLAHLPRMQNSGAHIVSIYVRLSIWISR